MQVKPHTHDLPLRVGTRGSPLALVQTRAFMATLREVCPGLRAADVLQEHIIKTTGDISQASGQRLADIGGKGLWAKEIHEALLDRRIDLAVHSLKDLETELPPGIVLAATLKREDNRDALILGKACGPADPANPLAALPQGAVIGSSSVRRQSQLLHARPDLTVTTLRGNVQTRLDKISDGAFDATLLALAGMRRLGLEQHASVVLNHDVLLPAACQGIVGVTARADDPGLLELLAAIEDKAARAEAEAERALLASWTAPAARRSAPMPGSIRPPRAARHRPGGARRRQLPAQTDPERDAGGRRADRPGARPQPARRQPGRHLRRMSHPARRP